MSCPVSTSLSFSAAACETERLTGSRFWLSVSTLACVLSLSACASVGYRCPLDPNETPDSPTACAGMHEAMQGARKNTGGKNSVFVDDKGRIVPPELINGTLASPISGSLTSANGRYGAPSGQPVYHNPRVFQVWSSSFVDSEGNLHDGRHSWFATPGQWNDAAVNKPHAVGTNIMRPTKPTDRPVGGVVVSDPYSRPAGNKGRSTGANMQPATQSPMQVKQSDKQALESLGDAATSSRRQAARQSAAGVTAPAASLGN